LGTSCRQRLVEISVAAGRAFHYKAHPLKAFQPRAVAASFGRRNGTGFQSLSAGTAFRCNPWCKERCHKDVRW
jgi:hypothetical protein